MSHRVNKEVTLRPVTSSSAFVKSNLKNIDDFNRRVGTSISSINIMLNYTKEINALMPNLLGVSANSMEFKKEVSNYWNNISVVVPEVGKKLEIGFIYKDEKTAKDYENRQSAVYSEYIKVREENVDLEPDAYKTFIEKFIDIESSKFDVEGNTPINASDYLLWRYCLIHGRVANLQIHTKRSKKIDVYIDDEAEVKRSKQAAYKVSAKARKLVYDNIGKRDTIQNILYIMNSPAADSKDTVEQDMAFDELATTDPIKFIQLIEDKKLNTKAFIERCITKGLLRRLPNTNVIVNAENDIVGNSIDDAIVYVESEKNKVIVDTLSAQLKNLK